jgi:hypothetical protein
MPDDVVTIVVALIGLAGVAIAALAGITGARLGGRIAADATTAAAAAARESARADRREARRARFADAIRDLAIEALEAADADVHEVFTQWRLRDFPDPTELPWRIGHRAHPVLRRLRMLVADPGMTAAINEFEHAINDVEALAVDTNKGNGMKIFTAGPAAEEERTGRAPAVDRYQVAVVTFEAAVRDELGTGSLPE